MHTKDMSASEALFSTGEPAYAVDRDGVIVAWNPAAESNFGYAESEAIGQYCWQLLAGQDLFGNQYCCRNCPLREMALHHKSIQASEMFFRTASHELKRFTVSMLVVGDAPGKELLVHLCRPNCEAVEGRATTICGIQPSASRQRRTLTTREKEVLTLLSQGKGTREIASDMCISPSTVRNHIQHILYKLHVHTRIAAINHARKLGLI